MKLASHSSTTGRRRAGRRVTALVVAGLMAGTALGSAVQFVPSTPAVAEQIALDKAPAQGFADLVETVMPAVFSVEVKFAPVADVFEDEEGDTGGMLPKLDPNNPFREFFENFRGRQFGMPNRPRRSRGQGSGFVISKDGYAVTNNHVIDGASEVTVKMSDGNEYQADVVGTDKQTDLALLKIKADKDFKYVDFADKRARVGDWVVAVGNPFGLGGTVTTGVVSASGRNLNAGPYDDYLQIDAPINRGNSGGPAFNLEGKVIGVNTAIFSPSGGSVGIGFAIPASLALDVIGDLKDKGRVTRGWLGVQIQPVTDEIAESLGMDEATGALVADVTPDSPAEAAGLKTQDAVLKVGDDTVKSPRDLARKVARLEPGKPSEFTVLRDGEERVIDVTIGTYPDDDEMAELRSSRDGRMSLTDLGLRLTPSPDGRGVAVAEVDERGPAADKGIRSGDVILEVGGVAVDDPAALSAALDQAVEEGKNNALLLVRSGDRQRFVALPVGKS